jgi:hypothetical protein
MSVPATTPTSRLQRYSGQKSKIKIDSWLALFGVVAVAQKADTDQKKLALLMDFLDDEALQWYADNVAPQIDTLTFAAVKTAMTKRFGQLTIDPVLAAQRRRLQKGETVQQYYEDKMYLLRQTGLKEESMAEILTDGMPHFYRTPLIASTIVSVHDWLNKAVRLESSFSTRPEKEFPARNPGTHPVAAQADTAHPKAKPKSKSKNKPSSACRFCQAQGKTEFHWHSDCPIRNSGRRSETAANMDDETEVISVVTKNY